MGMLQEFKEFAMKGNVVDMAVGVVIGGAFGKIVTALVEKVLMPITSFLTQGQSIADKAYTMKLPAGVAEGVKPAEIGYGAFLQSIIDFLIVAFAIFMMVKLMNAAKKRFEKEAAPAAPAAPPPEVKLLAEIRDLLKAR